ncbi:MAG: D-tyrosyl-tRNA(Tyr) deacylase [Clostridiales bacterium]|nr:D-tyrosyl-tRNA(Tyr) deacylase [Clostridiales bacterium]
MKAVLQRVLSASVEAEEEDGGWTLSGAIGPGALLLLGVEREDTEAQALLLARKAAQLRVFPDEAGRMNRSLLDTGGGALVVSNFTLCADCSHGRRPEFLSAARPEQAQPLYERFAAALREQGVPSVCTGRFGAQMRVHMTGDGPVTLLLDTADW